MRFIDWEAEYFELNSILSSNVKHASVTNLFPTILKTIVAHNLKTFHAKAHITSQYFKISRTPFEISYSHYNFLNICVEFSNALEKKPNTLEKKPNALEKKSNTIEKKTHRVLEKFH